MNKFQSKAIVKAYGLSTLPCVLVSKEKAILSLSSERNRILQLLKYPLFIKPNHLGSSIGISIAHHEEELNKALAKVFQYDDQALVEPYLEKIIEINVAVMDDNPPRATVVEIPIAKESALTYEDKYLRGGKKGTENGGMASLSRVIDPPDLQPAIKKSVIDQALQAFQLLDCSGICRFDFMHDLQSNRTYFNEVNPIPGSFAFYLWEKSNPRFLFTELIEKLIIRAKEKKSLQRSLKRDFGFHALLQ
jgi:D-alanine-D-alanine ligase